MLTASDVVASHRDAMIWHAITRARERHGLHLTVSDIERLNAQYRTNKLPVVGESGHRVITKKVHGTDRRMLCWSLDYGCYVAYSESSRTVVTFLPEGFSPDNPEGGRGVVYSQYSVPTPQRLKPAGVGWMESVLEHRRLVLESDTSVEGETKFLTRLIREAIVEWYCNAIGQAEFTCEHDGNGSFCRRVRLPDGNTMKPGEFYAKERGAIWYTIREYLGEPHDWIEYAKQYMAWRGWTINRGGWIKNKYGVVLCHGYQQLIKKERSNPNGPKF